MAKKFKVDACDSCRFETKVQLYEGPKKEKWLCGLCAGSLAGNAYEYPEQYECADLYGVVCHVGNAILKALADKREAQ